MNSEIELSADEQGRLQSLEAVIEKGKQTFMDVGMALMEIRRADLYRATHSTFENYCTERWGFSRPYANHIIRASQVAHEMGTIVPISNEGTAREFVSIPREDRLKVAEVAKDVAKEKGRDAINSRDVKEAKAKVYKVETRIEELPPDPDAEPLPTEPDPPTLVDDEEGDWLESLPLSSRLQGVPLRRFEEAAKSWLHMEPVMKSVAMDIRAQHKTIPSQFKSRFHTRQLSSFVIDEPQHWLYCAECKGTGQVPQIGNCSSCNGDGFQFGSYRK